MRKIIIILLSIFSVQIINGQTNDLKVINSAGKSYTSPVNGMYISDNVGEPFTQTIGPNNNVIITQGFLQPFTIGKSTGSIQVNQITCQGKNDGNLSIALNVASSNYSVQYFWTPQSICPANNCSSVDSLKSGNYKVKLRIIMNPGPNQKIDSSIVLSETIKDENGPCRVKIYNAVTLNADGVNDKWEIDNISEFPNNVITIFNRWGQKIFEAAKYDNTSIFWPEKENDKLTSGTYFYIINLNDGSNPIKGWVELIKN